ncbi:hypothetical protein ACFE04_008029 [Oxalis oulophora]
MESNSWNTTRLSTSSRRYQSRSDLYFGGGYEKETDGGDDKLRAEFLCPFCGGEFDILGLCCHIDEDHPIQAKNGVCPVCEKRVGSDIVSHITTQHGSILKISFDEYVEPRKRRLRKGAYSILRKELKEGALQSLLGGSSYFGNSDPDPLLSSFIYNHSSVDDPLSIKPLSSVKASTTKEESRKEDFLDRKVQPPLSRKDQEEKGRRSEFVQGLLMSTIFCDGL